MSTKRKASKKPQITQNLLQKLVKLREMKTALSLIEAQVKQMVSDGCVCERGRYSLKVKFTQGKRRPKWKEHFEQIASQHNDHVTVVRMIAKIIEETQPSEPTSSITIIDCDNPKASV